MNLKFVLVFFFGALFLQNSHSAVSLQGNWKDTIVVPSIFQLDQMRSIAISSQKIVETRNFYLNNKPIFSTSLEVAISSIIQKKNSSSVFEVKGKVQKYTSVFYPKNTGDWVPMNDLKKCVDAKTNTLDIIKSGCGIFQSFQNKTEYSSGFAILKDDSLLMPSMRDGFLGTDPKRIGYLFSSPLGVVK